MRGFLAQVLERLGNLISQPGEVAKEAGEIWRDRIDDQDALR